MPYWALLALVACPVPGLGCTIVLNAVTVGPSFKVKVENGGRPVEGLAVELRGSGPEHRLLTDRSGVVLFRNVPPGSYMLTAGPEADTATAALTVDLSRGSEDTVPLKWPRGPIISARSLKGTIRLPGSIPAQPQPSFPVELLQAVSGRVLKTDTTDESGAFEFSTFPSGLYFLRLLAPGFNAVGVIAVAVEAGAAANHLEIDLGWSSCGLFYTDQSSCPQLELHLGQLAGRVADTTGAAISDVEIILLDPIGKLVHRTRSDRSGHFAPRNLADGTYQLLVRSAGFATLRRTLTLNSESERSHLGVQLGILGGCSDARTQ